MAVARYQSSARLPSAVPLRARLSCLHLLLDSSGLFWSQRSEGTLEAGPPSMNAEVAVIYGPPGTSWPALVRGRLGGLCVRLLCLGTVETVRPTA